MAEEPQPPTVQEGASTVNAPSAPSADAAKEAAALSTLDARGEEEDAKPSNKLAIDQEALGKAISRLELSAGGGSVGKAKESLGGEYSKKREAEQENKRAEEDRKRKVKVNQADVALLVGCWIFLMVMRYYALMDGIGARARAHKIESYGFAENARRRCGEGHESFY